MDYLFDDEPSTAEQEAMKASALRRQQDAGLIAQLSGVRSLQPFGQSAIQSAGQGLEQMQQSKQQGLTRQLSLAKMIADAKEKALDDRRLQAQADEASRHNRFTEQHPTPLVAIGAGGTTNLINPRTMQATTAVDAQGNPIQKPMGGGAAGSPNSEKEWKELTEKIGTGARGTLAKDLQRTLNSSDALKALILGPNGDINNLTPQQFREATTALNGLIAKGGSNAVSQIEHLTPDTLASKFAEAKQYLLNEPQGANAQAFLKNFLETAQRETGVARKQLRGLQLQSLPNYAHLRGADQKRYESVLKGAGIDPTSVDENGLDIPAPGQAGDPHAALVSRIAALKAQGVTDPAAIKAQLVKEGLHGGQ